MAVQREPDATTFRHRSFLLECKSDDFRARPFSSEDIAVFQTGAEDVARCMTLWSTVGAGFWTERSRWSRARWQAHLRRAKVSFWIASIEEEDIGCFELTAMARGVKLQGFGLVPKDVVSSGGAVLDALAMLAGDGIEVDTAICVIDHETGGLEALAAHGVELRSLFRMNDIE